jgi:hypothetical protein
MIIVTILGCIALSGIYNVGSPLSDDENDWKNILYRKFYVERTFGLSLEVINKYIL